MRALDLFSGVGGWSLALHRQGLKTVAACEIDPWKRQQYARHFPDVRLYDDVCALTVDVLDRDGLLPIDFIVGSPPCTDISTANTKGQGVDGDESRLYFEATRLLREIRPRGCAFENSANLRTRGADRVVAEMEATGYAVWPLVVGAAHAGASHRRLRSWLVGLRRDLVERADADGEQRRSGSRQGDQDGHEPARRAGVDPSAHANKAGLRIEPGRGCRAQGEGSSVAAADASDADSKSQHALSVDGEVVRRTGDAISADTTRNGGGNSAHTDCTGLPKSARLGGHDVEELATIERVFGLGWSDGPGALAHHLRAADGISGRLATADRRDQRRLAAELAKGRSAYGDAVALPVVEAVVKAMLEAHRFAEAA